jgi:hypothetical protein
MPDALWLSEAPGAAFAVVGLVLLRRNSAVSPMWGPRLLRIGIVLLVAGPGLVLLFVGLTGAAAPGIVFPAALALAVAIALAEATRRRWNVPPPLR